MRLPMCALIVSAAAAWAQPPAPVFEAATVKPSAAGAAEGSSWHSRKGYLVMKNQTLNALIRVAYGLQNDQLSGGPKWIDSERFDIEARAAGPADDPELKLMLRALLAERFRLAIHRETKALAGYAM